LCEAAGAECGSVIRYSVGLGMFLAGRMRSGNTLSEKASGPACTGAARQRWPPAHGAPQREPPPRGAPVCAVPQPRREHQASRRRERGRTGARRGSGHGPRGRWVTHGIDPCGVAPIVFCVGVATDGRRFANAVSLGLCPTLLAVDLAGTLATGTAAPELKVLAAVAAVVPFAVTVTPAGYLPNNGVTVVRREGRAFRNLLSFVASAGILVVLALLTVAEATHWRALVIASGMITAATVHVAFLCGCFVGCGYLYGRVVCAGSWTTSSCSAPDSSAATVCRPCSPAVRSVRGTCMPPRRCGAPHRW
jgi:hypothetical protein